jgi:hypothetical protein
MKLYLALDVALSRELLAHLWSQSRKLKVPLEWVVAGLVCDTFDATQTKLVTQSIPAYAVA